MRKDICEGLTEFPSLPHPAHLLDSQNYHPRDGPASTVRYQDIPRILKIQSGFLITLGHHTGGRRMNLIPNLLGTIQRLLCTTIGFIHMTSVSTYLS